MDSYVPSENESVAISEDFYITLCFSIMKAAGTGDAYN